MRIPTITRLIGQLNPQPKPSAARLDFSHLYL
jgi:hypothetical protein